MGKQKFWAVISLGSLALVAQPWARAEGAIKALAKAQSYVLPVAYCTTVDKSVRVTILENVGRNAARNNLLAIIEDLTITVDEETPSPITLAVAGRYQKGNEVFRARGEEISIDIEFQNYADPKAKSKLVVKVKNERGEWIPAMRDVGQGDEIKEVPVTTEADCTQMEYQSIGVHN